jgi:hypothetical protein
MPGRAVHIHLGPSKLGLGLIVPITVDLGMEVHLVGREGAFFEPGFGISFAAEGAVSFYRVDSFEGPESFEELNPDARQALDSPRPVLITSTLRGAIDGRYQFVRELLTARVDCGGETLFIACENMPHELYGRLREEFEPQGITFLSTMVNRICPTFIEGHDPRRIVRAHPLGEWVIKSPPKTTSLVELLRTSTLVDFVPDLEPYEVRKRWLVNGGQLQLAILAHSAKKRSLRAAANRPGLRDPVNHFHAEANRVLESVYPELERNLTYGIEHVIAFCEITDEVKRVLDIRRANLSPFFTNFDSRFGEPARRAAELAGGKTPEIFLDCLLTLERLLEHRRAYNWMDPIEPRRRARLSADVDAKALAAYESMLTGWLPATAIDVRVQRLDLILTAHRDGSRPPTPRVRAASRP